MRPNFYIHLSLVSCSIAIYPATSGLAQEGDTTPSGPCLSQKEVRGGYPKYRIINGRHCWYASTRDRSEKPIRRATANKEDKGARAGGPEGWSTYVDQKTGTTVKYPANIFSVKDDSPSQKAGTTFGT